jgi:UDP-N-acetylmuramyl pentapeptide phosphotransferase/UDP-N-acetylglucosamine-1-phosphate transferase
VKLIAMVLIVLGVIGLIWGGVSYTKKDKVVDLGPVEVTRTEHKSIPLPPVVGGLLLVAGVVLLVANGRRTIP